MSQAPVDWERASSLSNAVPFTLRPSLRSFSGSWCLVSSCFICISSSSLIHPNRFLLLHFALFEQLGCALGSCFCSHCRSLLELYCFALHLLLVACLCLYMQANDSSNLLCTFLFLSDILQRNWLDRAQACFNAAVAWVFFLLEGKHFVGRGPLVCWVDLNLQLFYTQSLF